MINTQTETFRGYGKIGTVGGQTAVECRFGAEVETVLSVHASAALTGAEAGNGEIRYFGKAHFFLVYEDTNKKLCRGEKGVEFSAVVKDERCFPALAVQATLAVENVSVRREGASVFASALLGADISLFGEQNFEYVSGGDVVTKREPVKVTVAHLCGGAAETEDEFETEFIGDIMQHTETVNVTDVVCETGTLRIEGEVNLGVLALKGEDYLVAFERLVPFKIEIPCEACAFSCTAEANVSVLSVSLSANADEERGRCGLNVVITLNASAVVYEEHVLDGITDAFSKTHEIKTEYCEVTAYGAGEIVRTAERISGKAALSSPINFSDELQAVSCQRAEANLVRVDNGFRIEGVALATLFVHGTDGCRGVEISLPFSVPTETNAKRVSVMVCGTSVRQKQEGEIDAEATLKITFFSGNEESAKIVCAIEEGEPVPENDCAVSVFIPREGDGLWELAKSLKKTPEEVAVSNPDVTFPVRAGQRIVIYRKKSLD